MSSPASGRCATSLPTRAARPPKVAVAATDAAPAADHALFSWKGRPAFSRQAGGRSRRQGPAKAASPISAMQFDGYLRHALALEFRAFEFLRGGLTRAIAVRHRRHAVGRAATHDIDAG